MIFQHTWQQVLDGTKTQTRRLVKPEEWYSPVMDAVFTSQSGRLKWQVGNTYAVQPGRTKAAIGRIRITGIRRERVQDITEEDAIAEGAWPKEVFSDPVLDFSLIWDDIHTAPGATWAENPMVWCLTFHLVKEIIDGA